VLKAANCNTLQHTATHCNTGPALTELVLQAANNHWTPLSDFTGERIHVGEHSQEGGVEGGVEKERECGRRRGERSGKQGEGGGGGGALSLLEQQDRLLLLRVLESEELLSKGGEDS